MRVFYSTTGKVLDGQLEAAVAASADAAAVVGRHGGEVRVFMSVAAGEQVDSTLFSIEYESPAAMGRAFDAMNTDPELYALRARTQGAGAPTTSTSASMGMELPIAHTSKGGRGSVLEIHTSQIKPGRMAEFIADAPAYCAFVEANGALNARVVQLTYAGMASGLASFLWEYESLEAMAATADAWWSDAGLALQAKGPLAADAPSVTVASALYSEIPL